MKLTSKLMIGAAACAAIAMTAWAGVATRTFRTTARIYTVSQDTNNLGKPAYSFATMDGRTLINLVLGTEIGTVRTNEVLALEVDCASSQANLVVFDLAGQSNITTIATSTTLDVVQQQDNANAAFPNRERFVAQMAIQAGGSSSNALIDGTLTVAGRLDLNPTNGCPRAVLMNIDRDKLDKTFCDVDFKSTEDLDKTVLRAGIGHAIGSLDALVDGNTNKFLIPYMQLSIRRQLAP